ncbi:MAG: DUF1330 domain-containing protein [Betaproteobacteria bacterium]|nr:DUF1330 domain-containing protein [Betaproteobacteria bacterium]
MAAYLISEVEVHNPQGYEEYRKLVGPSLAKYNGKFLVRGGKVETIEGDWIPKRMVVCEFESLAKAHEWYDSPEYARAKAVALQHSTRRIIFLEGV